MTIVDEMERRELSKSILPADVNLRIRFSERSTPHGCICVLVDRLAKNTESIRIDTFL